MSHEHAPGRLIRVTGDQRDPPSVVYIVAVDDSADALVLVGNIVGSSNSVEDRGQVSAELLRFLKLQPGEAKALGRPPP
jgi:hypothetical protein